MKHFDASSFEAGPAEAPDWQSRICRLEAALAEAERAADEASARASRVKEICLETTTDCVFEINGQWQLTYLNRRAQDEVAQGRDLVGHHVLAAFPDLSGSIFWQRFSQVMETREAKSADGYFPLLNAWYEVHVAPTDTGLIAFFRNITNRKTAEAELRSQQRQVQNILDSVPQIIFTTDPEGRCTFISRRWNEFYGRSTESDTGFGWLDGVHPEDRMSERAWVRARHIGEPFEFHFRLRHASGEYRWLLVQASPSKDAEGNVVCWYGSCTDIHDRILAQEELSRSESRFRSILDSLPEMVWSAQPDGGHDYFNRQWLEFTAARIGSGDLEVAWEELVHPEDLNKVRAAWNHSLATGEAYGCEYRMRRRDGEFVWTRSRARPERDAGGSITRWYGTCADIEDEVKSAQALKVSEALSRGIIENSPDYISILDKDGTVLHSNRATLELYASVGSLTIIGKPWGCHLNRGNKEAAARALKAAAAGELGRVTMSFTIRNQPVWIDVLVAPLDTQDAAKFVVISRDITHQKATEEKVRWTANHDALTRLPNRSLFHTQLGKLISTAERTGKGFAVLLLDLDDFKRTNDTLGHDAGDALLSTFAKRLQSAARKQDVVARLGGDEFAVLLAGVENEKDLAKAVERVSAQLREPCIHDRKLLDLHASIGASLYPNHGSTSSELLKHADLALYAAKTTTRGRCRMFEQGMREESQRRSSMLNLARQALTDDLIHPFYQPKVNLETGKVEGFEALLRWMHPTRGVQLPKTIEAAFDDLNLAAEVSDRMIDQVLVDMQQWKSEGVDVGHIAINASAAEFRPGDFAERLLERLHRASLPTSRLQLEVTETVFLGRGAEYVERALKLLSKEGMEIALDDFGTGYASLSHLKQFPVNVIKIDRSFVRDIHTDPEDAAIVSAVISLGKSLGISVVGEGVETLEQHRYLGISGCNVGQGFLYGKAVPRADVATVLTKLAKAGGWTVDKGRDAEGAALN